MDLIHEEDENAFLIVGDANSITGEGFRPVKPEDKTIRELAAALKEKRRVRKTGKQGAETAKNRGKSQPGSSLSLIHI